MNTSESLINTIFESELSLFKQHFHKKPIPKIQDQRSLALAWLCYFFHDLISNENKIELVRFVDEIQYSEDYHLHGWYKISALQAAAFALTSDIDYANNLIEHLDCEQGWARHFVLKSVGFIGTSLTFNNPILKKATENNIEKSHGGYEENTVLYLLTHGTLTEKQNWLNCHLETDKTRNYKTLLGKIQAANYCYESSFFLQAFNEAKSYLLLKLLYQPKLVEIQPELFKASEFQDENVYKGIKWFGTQSTLLNHVELSLEEFIALENNHTLNNSRIDLNFLTGAITSLHTYNG